MQNRHIALIADVCKNLAVITLEVAITLMGLLMSGCEWLLFLLRPCSDKELFDKEETL